MMPVVAVIIFGLQAPEFIDHMTLDEVVAEIDSCRISGRAWRFRNRANQTVIIPSHQMDKILAIYQDAIIKPIPDTANKPSLVR
jgi:hypothetical protein